PHALEGGLAGQQRRRHAALREPPRLGDGGGQCTLQLGGVPRQPPFPHLRPAALDALHLQHPAHQRGAEAQAGERQGRQARQPEGGRPVGRPDREQRDRDAGRARRPRPARRAPVQPLRRGNGRGAAGERDVSAPLHLKTLVPDEVRFILERDARLLVPVGTCEQHGPHLPLGCDTLIVERLADDLSGALEILRAPTIEYGVNTATKRPFPGNASVRRKTLHRWMNDLLGSWRTGRPAAMPPTSTWTGSPRKPSSATRCSCRCWATITAGCWKQAKFTWNTTAVRSRFIITTTPGP